jgi:hypothetical protein
MPMPMHNHEVKTRETFCPLMREVCRDGWTPSMGENEKTKERPRCSRWVGVFVNDHEKKHIREICDCLDQWTPDLLQQVAQEVFQGSAATESTRNHVAGQATAFKRMSVAFVAMARKNGVTPELLEQVASEQAVAEQKQLEGGTSL